MAILKQVAGCPEIDHQLKPPVRLDQRGFGPGIPKAGADKAIPEVVGLAVGTNAHQFGSKVGVDPATGSKLDAIGVRGAILGQGHDAGEFTRAINRHHTIDGLGLRNPYAPFLGDHL